MRANMGKEQKYEPASTLEMGSVLPSLSGIRAHYAIKINTQALIDRDIMQPGYSYSEALQAGVDNLKKIVGDTSLATGSLFATEAEANAKRQKINKLDTTEVVFLEKEQEYFLSGSGEKKHGVDDGVEHN